MFETLIQEAAALASLALFIAMIAIWTQYWKICDRSRRTAAACHHRSGIAWCCMGSPSIHAYAPLYSLWCRESAI